MGACRQQGSNGAARTATLDVGREVANGTSDVVASTGRTTRRVAVIGGGVVGCTVAWRIRQALGDEVDLYERRDDILLETSAGTSNRFHGGYQYVRSAETAASLRSYQQRFEEIYGRCIVPSANYYGVADDSAISPAGYLDFCARCDLPFEQDRPSGVFTDRVVLSVLSEERSLDPTVLRDLCRQKLREWDVTIIHAEASRATLEGYDHVISAVYSNPNLLRHPAEQQEHHFSLCEMVLVELPDQYAGRSAMVVYGPFMTVDVLGSTGHHVLYHGDHGVHHVNVGRFADVPADYQPFLYRCTPAHELDGLTRAPLALGAASRYFSRHGRGTSHRIQLRRARADPGSRRGCGPADHHRRDPARMVQHHRLEAVGERTHRRHDARAPLPSRCAPLDRHVSTW